MLTGLQVGKIWDHIKKVMRDHPNQGNEVDVNIDSQQFIEMPPWEKDLKSLIDDDDALPSYDELGIKWQELMETLVQVVDSRVNAQAVSS